MKTDILIYRENLELQTILTNIRKKTNEISKGERLTNSCHVSKLNKGIVITIKPRTNPLNSSASVMLCTENISEMMQKVRKKISVLQKCLTFCDQYSLFFLFGFKWHLVYYHENYGWNSHFYIIMNSGINMPNVNSLRIGYVKASRLQ